MDTSVFRWGTLTPHHHVRVLLPSKGTMGDWLLLKYLPPIEYLYNIPTQPICQVERFLGVAPDLLAGSQPCYLLH
jgi:hypothetical protein